MARAKARDKKYWRSVVDELIAQEAVMQEGDPYPVLKITTKGFRYPLRQGKDHGAEERGGKGKDREGQGRS